MSIEADLRIMGTQFLALMGFELPPHTSNPLAARRVRLDHRFEAIADALYRDPSRGDGLWRFALQWLSRCNCEETRALAGHVAYCREDYPRATLHFLSAVAANPRNLDHWVDLAFSLVHQDDPLGRELLFDHVPYMEAFASRGVPVCTLAVLREIGRALEASGEGYRASWRSHVPAEAVRVAMLQAPAVEGETLPNVTGM